MSRTTRILQSPELDAQNQVQASVVIGSGPRPTGRRLARILLVGAAVFAGLLLIGSIATAAAIYREGSVSISVQEKGPDGQRIHLWIPGALLRAGLVFVPDSAWREARTRTRNWGPAIRALSAGLANSPDGTFFHVEDRDERVIISKTGDTLVIDVNSKEESVHVSVPLRTMDVLVHRVAPGTTEL